MTLRIFHKWLSLAIGLQIVIWVGSGTIISLLDDNLVSGRVTKNSQASIQAIGVPGNLFSPAKLTLSNTEKIRSIKLSMLNGNLVYHVKGGSKMELFDAKTGISIAINKQTATRKAQESYRGNGALLTTELLPNGSQEIRSNERVWRVHFDDKSATRVYVSATDGAVLEHRNRYWKVVDFLLMLHFMDYAREHKFNNIQIILVGFAALWLALSGLLLVKTNFKRRDFTWRELSR